MKSIFSYIPYKNLNDEDTVYPFEWSKRGDVSFLFPSLRKRSECEESEKYVNSIYDKYIDSLVNALNKYHQIERSKKYWELIIGFWFSYFIHTVYEKYVVYLKVREKYPNITYLKLHSQKNINIVDLFDFEMSSYYEVYNLQIFSRVLDFYGEPNIENVSLDRDYQYSPQQPLKFMDKLKLYIRRWLNEFAKVTVFRGYFSGKKSNKALVLGSRLKVSMMEITKEAFLDIVERQSREEFKFENINDADFEKFLVYIIPLEIPTAFLEGREKLLNCVRTTFGCSRKKAIFSAIGWHHFEVFKLWAAEQQHLGAQLIGIQHGGDYGLISKNDEIRLLDKFYSWGWHETHSHVVPFYSTKLSNKSRAKEFTGEGILLCGTFASRYGFRCFGSSYTFDKYLENAENFISFLSKECFENLKFRFYGNEIGWGIAKRFSEKFDGINFDTWENSILTSLEQAKMYVGDHLSTTYLEALNMNLPTVLFWDDDNYLYSDFAVEYLEKLRGVNILHSTAESAAKFINKNYDNIEEWWFSKPVQNVRDEFCAKFARTSEDRESLWLNEFKKHL